MTERLFKGITVLVGLKPVLMTTPPFLPNTIKPTTTLTSSCLFFLFSPNITIAYVYIIKPVLYERHIKRVGILLYLHFHTAKFTNFKNHASHNL